MHIEKKKTIKAAFIAAVICILLYWILIHPEGIKSVYGFLYNMFSPFIIGACIAFILNVPMRALERVFKFVKNNILRRTIALTITVIGLLLILTIVALLLIPALLNAVLGLIDSIPKLEAFARGMKDSLKGLLNDYKTEIAWVKSNVDIAGMDWSGIGQYFVNIFMGVVKNMLGLLTGIFGALLDAFIAVVFAIYCLFQKETLARQGRKVLYAFIPEKRADGVVKILRLTNATFSKFLSGQCIEVCILGLLFAIVMAIFRMPYIPLISVLIAVTAFIPIVGAWIGCIIGSFLIFIHDPTSLQFLWFVILSIVVQQVENNLIYPKVVGTSIGLSGMWVLVAVAVGGELFGVVGMFLMIPAASVIYTLVREYTNKRLSKIKVNPEKFESKSIDLETCLKETEKDKSVEKSADSIECE